MKKWLQKNDHKVAINMVNYTLKIKLPSSYSLEEKWNKSGEI
jgi:hypothetical protein